MRPLLRGLGFARRVLPSLSAMGQPILIVSPNAFVQQPPGGKTALRHWLEQSTESRALVRLLQRRR